VTARRIVRFVGLFLGAIGGVEYAVYILTQVSPGFAQRVEILVLSMVAGAIFGFFGLEYITIRPFIWVETKLRVTPLPDLFSALGGLTIGLVLAALAGIFLRDLPFGLNLVTSAALALVFGYWGISLGLQRRGEILALVRGWPQDGEARIVLDTSVLIDGRVIDIARSGFIAGRLLAPHFMLVELQNIADSAEPIRRQRGRRGLEIMEDLRHMVDLTVDITDHDYPDVAEVDHKLIRLAREQHAAILTTDYNLNMVAQLEGVRVLNINDLANALKPAMVPGEEITVTPVKEGKEPNQGVAYLADGTMVVVEGARHRLGETLTVSVTSVIQTAAGRMIFAAVPPGGVVVSGAIAQGRS
jgi:uncharacterized protein YacL